jgi:ATP-dependent Lon protease
MNVYWVDAPDQDAARLIARNLYQSIREAHGWGRHFDAEPGDDLLDLLAELAPREMRRALMTGFGNARLDNRDSVVPADLPRVAGRKSAIGFVQ